MIFFRLIQSGQSHREFVLVLISGVRHWFVWCFFLPRCAPCVPSLIFLRINQLIPAWPTRFLDVSQADSSLPSLRRFVTPPRATDLTPKIAQLTFSICCYVWWWGTMTFTFAALQHESLLTASVDTDSSSKQVRGSKVSLAWRSNWVDSFHFCTKWCFLPPPLLSLVFLSLALSPVTCWNTFRSWVELLSAHSSLCVVFEDYYAQRHPHWASRQLRGQNP